jgi:hypothetical protein
LRADEEIYEVAGNANYISLDRIAVIGDRVNKVWLFRCMGQVLQ